MINMNTKRPKITLTFLVSLLILVAVSLAGCAALKTATPQAQALPADISVKDAAALRDQGVFLLDVRTQDEWNQAHIQGATLVTLDQLESNLTLIPKDKQIVVYCHSGNRSSQARDILLKDGYPQVTSVTGGISEWIAEGFPTVSGP